MKSEGLLLFNPSRVFFCPHQLGGFVFLKNIRGISEIRGPTIEWPQAMSPHSCIRGYCLAASYMPQAASVRPQAYGEE